MGLSGYLNLSVSMKNVVSVIRVEAAHSPDHRVIQIVAKSFSSGLKNVSLHGYAQFPTPATLRLNGGRISLPPKWTSGSWQWHLHSLTPFLASPGGLVQFFEPLQGLRGFPFDWGLEVDEEFEAFGWSMQSVPLPCWGNALQSIRSGHLNSYWFIIGSHPSRALLQRSWQGGRGFW